MVEKIDYQINLATELQILEHLSSCNKNFNPPLSEKVNLIEYSKKIKNCAINFEAWNNNKLIALVAAYCNDVKNKKAFITNVSTEFAFFGKGIANNLLIQTIKYAKKNNFLEIYLEVNIDSIPAIKLYKKNNFFEIEKKESTLLMKHKIK